MVIKTQYVKCWRIRLHFSPLASCCLAWWWCGTSPMLLVTNSHCLFSPRLLFFPVNPLLGKFFGLPCWNVSSAELFLPCHRCEFPCQRALGLLNLAVCAHYGKAEGRKDNIMSPLKCDWLNKSGAVTFSRLVPSSQAHIKKFCGDELKEFSLYCFLKCFWMRSRHLIYYELLQLHS